MRFACALQVACAISAVELLIAKRVAFRVQTLGNKIPCLMYNRKCRKRGSTRIYTTIAFTLLRKYFINNLNFRFTSIHRRESVVLFWISLFLFRPPLPPLPFSFLSFDSNLLYSKTLRTTIFIESHEARDRKAKNTIRRRGKIELSVTAAAPRGFSRRREREARTWGEFE